MGCGVVLRHSDVDMQGTPPGAGHSHQKHREALGVGLLVGEIGSGKTTVCRRVAAAARRSGLRVGGILTRPLRDAQGRRSGLLAVDLWRGESRLLASLRRSLSDLQRGPYSFDPAAFDWAIQATLSALDEDPDLIIVDEIGPVELQAGAGLAPLLDPLLAAGRPTLLVVRRSCRPALEARLAAEPLVFEVSLAARRSLPREILAALCEPAVIASGAKQ